MLNKISRYWWCQIIGWSVNIGISIFFVTTFGKANKLYISSLVLTCIAGLLVTHTMRLVIHRSRILEKPLKLQVWFFTLLTFAFSVLFGICSELIDYIIGYNPLERAEKYTRGQRLFLSSFNAMWLILMWNFIYFIYHHVEKNRKRELDTFRLEALVKSLELKTIKSHINPHFIFNALNSIRALVDENPERARTAITELSNILRSSMRAEKQETVPLQQELNIVKDYLALEHMRFEERLKIEFDVAENTLMLPVPPMMLQTLVENAIKHGISKQIYGGKIRISSKFNGDSHELIVQNSGKLNGTIDGNAEGFGLKSTQDRLNLMYNGKANFEIYDINGNMVQSKVNMPITTFL